MNTLIFRTRIYGFYDRCVALRRQNRTMYISLFGLSFILTFFRIFDWFFFCFFTHFYRISIQFPIVLIFFTFYPRVYPIFWQFSMNFFIWLSQFSRIFQHFFVLVCQFFSSFPVFKNFCAISNHFFRNFFSHFIHFYRIFYLILQLFILFFLIIWLISYLLFSIFSWFLIN